MVDIDKFEKMLEKKEQCSVDETAKFGMLDELLTASSLDAVNFNKYTPDLLLDLAIYGYQKASQTLIEVRALSKTISSVSGASRVSHRHYCF